MFTEVEPRQDMNAVQEENERGSQNSGGHSPKTAARHRALREALLDAAERRIAATGLVELKARDLAQEAGCALGALYNVFEDLDALILGVNMRTFDALEAALDAAGEAGGDPVARIEALADAYLTYAAANRRRWATLFEHRMAGDRPTPDWYRARLAHLFAHVEAPLGALCPVLDEAARACLARSLFSAVQGVVALGLDEKVGPMPEPTLRAHLRLLARAMAQGLKPGG